MTCARQVFPPAVIESITRQMEGYVEDTLVEIPERMRVQDCLRKADLSEALALSLAVFAAMYPELMDGYTIFGVVKEPNVDGLAEFINVYFRGYPVYADKTYAFYKALGDRKVGLSALFNPFSVLGALCEAWTRIRRKKIQGSSPTAGEGIVQGGLIIFDEMGTPQAMYPEETGVDLRVTELADALHAIRRHCNKKNMNRPPSSKETGTYEEKKMD